MENPARPADWIYLPLAAIWECEFDKRRAISVGHTERSSVVVGYHDLALVIVYEGLYVKV
jgi:hypothetical protein